MDGFQNKGKMSQPRGKLLLLFLIIFAACTVWLIAYHVSAAENEAQMTALQKAAFSSQQASSSREIPSGSSACNSATLSSKVSKASKASTASSSVRAQPRFKKLQEQNSDIEAWIQIEGTKVNYPVMQTPKNPEFYLHRNLKKQEESRGLPFLDAKSTLKKSRNYLVYGHNMKDGTAFAGLLGYLNQNFCKEHPIIRFDTPYGMGDYRVIAVFRSRIYTTDSKAFKYYQYADIETQEAFNTYITNVKKREDYTTGMTASYGDQLLTLSTCYKYVEDGRLVIVAKKVR
ncbi:MULTISPECIES: class B sortase [Caproicibacterium]|jgi:sortase B|uniref:Sortase n=1 Tax=Caproicibacterium lactatifermentans TaxID=2666138 RepID=A0A859DQR6_9FIRM|nr:class B sortase [Caproicibacterium lactatifermentans]ARP49992.1 hypothetical protein B6259_03320 [Ruminococcaceae bacterium CPB6]MDD4807477.1 class B sortase [Oscillospiraceae bacterium]QKN24228.1 sortase [Caproicibacterium lactatifermentans]QKO30701.1 sortase [Caproicibacterium lactatifermentans]